MLFFFKEKPHIITAFVNTDNASAAKLQPIAPAIKYTPKWWKEIPTSKFDWEAMHHTLTVKSCPGIISTLRRGFVLPLWSDVAIKYNDNSWTGQFADKKTGISWHEPSQSPEFYSDYWRLKLESPWIIESPVDLLYTHPFYLFQQPVPYTTPPGIVSPFGKCMATNYFLFLQKRVEETRLILKMGTPLFHIIPLTEKKVELKIEILEKEEFNSRASVAINTSVFVNKFPRYKKALASLNSKLW